MAELKAARLIKRYENRKLYDTVDKRYVSLAEIAGFVRAGEEVTVLENATGADITAETLAKIIVDEGSKNLPLLQADSLHELVRWGGKVMTDGAQQFRRNMDRLLEASLQRLSRRFGTRQEMDRLRQKVDDLELHVRKLVLEVTHEHNDDGTETKSQQGPDANNQ